MNKKMIKVLSTALALGLTLTAVPMTATAGGVDGQETTYQVSRSRPACGHEVFLTTYETKCEEDNDFYHCIYERANHYCYQCDYTYSEDWELVGYEAHDYVQDSPDEMWHCHQCDKYMNF